ncbi:MAG: polyprenyl synthetase family protein, partial [Nitrososphaerales archaeon]
QYISMIGKKTAALFETSCELGAVCAQTNKGDVDNLAKFGRNLGIAFQLVDDLIGVAGDPRVTKKPVGNDIREGKKTLPILLAIKKAKGQDRDKILRIFGTKNASETELKEAVSVLVNAGVDRDVRNMARFYATKAIDSIKGYDDSKAKRALQSLADFVVERTL